MVETLTIETGGTWTHFMDMHSGGGCKTDYEHIYIQAPEEQAVKIFEEKFGRDPHNVTCNCCGSDYSISEDSSLEEITRFQRGKSWLNNREFSLEEYLNKSDVFVLYTRYERCG